MADLKSLKVRINSICKTQKITKAMKMVAASKLRKARESAEASRDYSTALQNILISHVGNRGDDNMRDMVYGVENPKNYLLVVVTTDRGLCGGLNGNLVRFTMERVNELEKRGCQANLLCIGKKGYDQLKNLCGNNIISSQEGFSVNEITYDAAVEQMEFLVGSFENEQFDVCEVIYPAFKTSMTQESTRKQLIPCESNSNVSEESQVQFEYEPKKEVLLQEVLKKNVAVQIFQAFLETYASEQGSRMTAMDNAVNNCGELIKKLNLVYNRTRQAKITTELIEIIAAVESV